MHPFPRRRLVTHTWMWGVGPRMALHCRTCSQCFDSTPIPTLPSLLPQAQPCDQQLAVACGGAPPQLDFNRHPPHITHTDTHSLSLLPKPSSPYLPQAQSDHPQLAVECGGTPPQLDFNGHQLQPAAHRCAAPVGVLLGGHTNA